MRRGFTVLELLVASLLLGMLTTVLTMIFNQSSIAWRTGTAMVADLDEVRDNIATLRDESDNAFVWDGDVYRLVGLWDSEGNLNVRACCGESLACSEVSADNDRSRPNLLLQKKADLTKQEPDWWTSGQNVFPSIGQGDRGDSARTYTVNVMSAGPDREFDTWDDIWSFPDDFE